VSERALRVGVPRDHWQTDSRTGAGRVWKNVLPVLSTHAHVGPPSLIQLRRPDVWLLPAQGRPVEVREPVVAVIHGAAWMLDPSALELMPVEFAEPFVAATEATLARSARAIVPSDYTRRALTEGFGMRAEDVDVVPHGVDAAVFNPRAGRGPARVLMGKRPYVLFASIPSIPQKNLAALKDAVAILAARGRPHALVIAGGPAGGESPELLAEIGSDPPGHTGRVEWLGHVDEAELAALMAGADAFCLPSLHEAFGLTALEALACGAPAVVSNTGALPEVVGDAALLSEPTPEALAESLDRVLSDGDLAARLRAAGPERARTMTWNRTGEGWLRALRSAAGMS
jgi:glycosyltransferase involved in cell wall biosynthesis